MKWQPLVFGFAALAFAIRAIRSDSGVMFSWIAAAAFAGLAIVWLFRSFKT